MSVRSTALLAVLAVALTLGGSAGAGTASQPPKKIDLTNPAAVDSYLTSIGVNPATVVRQVGLLNYAGPNCPGVGWNCTTSTKAVQVSSPGGHNKFECDPAATATVPSTNTCVIMQGGDDNKAQCKIKGTGVPTESQSCLIQQNGEDNLAIVDQAIDQNAGSDQTATQTADVQQTATDKNQSQIHQDVNQTVKTGAVQDQNVHQVARVNQYADGSQNFSHVHQDQDLNASGAATTQNQNIAPDSSGAFDCDPEGKSTSPNACASIVQAIGGSGGKNDSHLHQNVSERAKTTASGSTQTQESDQTGIEAHIDQSNPPFLGSNQKTVHQDARQNAAGGTNQFQTIDPHCCGVGTTAGGANNTDNLDQTAMQSATSGAAAVQRLGILGDTNHVTGGDFAASAASSSTDVCRISHNASNNSDSSHQSFTVNPCTGPVAVTTTCFSGGGDAPTSGAGSCTTTPPGGGGFTATVIPSSATLGNPIAPPDFGEPSDFPGPIFPGI
jgi:hypothetical protein